MIHHFGVPLPNLVMLTPARNVTWGGELAIMKHLPRAAEEPYNCVSKLVY